MDQPSVKTEKPKLEELTLAQLIVLLKEAMQRNQIVGEKAQRNASMVTSSWRRLSRRGGPNDAPMTSDMPRPRAPLYQGFPAH